MLIKEALDQEKLVKCLRVLEPLIREIVEYMLRNHGDSPNLIHIIATVAQFTDKCNFSMLSYLVKIKSIAGIFQFSEVKRGLETIFRLFEA